LVSAAAFLILAISAFRLDPNDSAGRYLLTATSDQPIHYDLNSEAGRRELGFLDHDNREFGKYWRVDSMRVAAGEDASCLNLYKPTQPGVLGVPESFSGERWAEAARDIKGVSPYGGKGELIGWPLLGANLGVDDAARLIVPVALDENTATYSLH